ncbi:MAG: hypothetical protein LBJ73_02020 [Rickettsiales bacterium]|jgi:hypothetical protein|nr:hypothetical protein [Rickettsiales bacterium]
MNRVFRFFIVALCLAPILSAQAAVQVKKAATVTTKSSAGTEGAASLVPTVIGLVSNIIEMNAKQNALTAECIPSSAEMTFVDSMMKEWAKSGQTTASALQTLLRRTPCLATDNGYASEAANSASAGLSICYNSFAGTGNENMVWEKFPKTGKGTYCKSGAYNCTGSDLITVSDTYDLFNLIDFGVADYTMSEATMAAKLLNKVETCSSSKLSAKKKAMWGEFLTTTAGSLGQSTNTGAIMNQVGGIASGGGAGALGSLGSIAQQFIK